jgi:hypothetical protein
VLEIVYTGLLVAAALVLAWFAVRLVRTLAKSRSKGQV